MKIEKTEERNIRETELKRGDMVWVYDGGRWRELIFFDYDYETSVICVNPTEVSKFKKNLSFRADGYRKWSIKRPKGYKPKVKISIEEIAEKFNLEVEQIQIQK